MTNSVLKTQTPEERELARYMSEMAARNSTIAALQADIEALKDDLTRFNAEYHTRIGAILLEIDRVELEIAELEIRSKLREERPDLSDEAAAKEAREAFCQHHEDLNREEQKSNRYRQRLKDEEQKPQLSESEADELKALFRELAKRFHPDLARTDVERVERTAIMQRVTAAFHAHDLAALQSLLAEEDVKDEAFEDQSIGTKLVWAIRELARLAENEAERRRELSALQSSALGKLRQAFMEDDTVLDRLERDAQRRLNIARGRLADAKLTFSE